MTVALARVSDAPLLAQEAEDAVLSIADGALVTFRGVVRDADEGRGVLALDYSAHPEAERFLRESCERIAAETGLTVAALHRVGNLRIGDVALVAAVAAPHRAEAFAACGRLVDDIKTSVPIWKRQHYEDGVSDWVGL
ncbi:molybdenum cofactor biosynthesis protein MoaE [Naasia aerilata]|uniref:Molybdenum cofactor biosynthesis protein MoaE n=1 Tax=Naasia aerilata TaxID=1162966 RepID=A0ABM8GD88_9MICO|nr:molybdenum cofactor biosynthesis protein MoaE [Naasia aerilata]BDZ46242.1 molybdenum cofactor biosynthesis protein MoaE [Naasia aerilata]